MTFYSFLQECEEELKDLSSEEIVLHNDVSERLENLNLQDDSPPSTGCGEDGSIVTEEKKASYLSIIFLIILVTVYPGFNAILYLYFVLYLKPRKHETCGQSNICDSTVENFGLLHTRYNDSEIYDAIYMLDEKLAACLKARINEFKLTPNLYNGKKVTKNCRTLLEDNEDGYISNSGLNTSEDSDGKLIDDSTGLIRRKTMENYNVQIDNFNVSDVHSHSQTYIGDLPVNGSDFMNIFSSVNKMAYNYEESELTDFSSKTEGHCEMQLKAEYNILKENPATSKNCSKAPVECFGTSSHGCNELNMSFVIQSSNEKTVASTSNSKISVDSWTREVTEKSHKENNEIQNDVDNKGDRRFHDQRNVTDLQDNRLPWVSFVDDAPLQEGNDENDESNYSPEKQGVSRETPTVDEPKLGKVLTLTTDSIHCQDQNCSSLTDVSNVVYGDFKVHADSGNPSTSNEYSIELVSKCENKSNMIAEVSSQVLRDESGSHHALNNTLNKQGNDREKMSDVCVVEHVGWEMKSGKCSLPCSSLKMQKAYSKISHDNNISAFATDCRISSDWDCSSEIDLEGLKCESEVHNSIFDKLKEMSDMPSIYLKRENERRERNTVTIQGRTKLGCIYRTVDGAKVHGKMLAYQR